MLRSLSGMDATVIDMLDNYDRGFYFGSRETSLAIVDGFTITNANAGAGAGFYCTYSSPTIRNCRISHCYAAGDIYPEGQGGAGALVHSSSLIENCIIEDNSAHTWGGGLYVSSSNVTMRSCVFASCNGAVYIRSFSVATIEGCTFLNNLWGVVSISSLSTASISGCTFVGNGALYPVIQVHSEYGDGIEISRSVFALNGSGAPVECGSIGPDISYCCFFETGADSLCGSSSEELNLFEDPLLCDFYSNDYTLCANSPCLPENNDWAVLIGAHDQGCPPCETPVERMSWGSIKALFR